MSAPITLIGNISQEPDLKFSQSGKAWVRFSVVTSARFFNKETQKWEEKDATFWNCAAFGKLAENIAESAVKGTRVVVTGNVKAEKYQGKDGLEKTDIRVIADEVALSVKFNAVKAAVTTPKPAANDGWGMDEPPF